ncbi:TerD family protein [Streptomyces antibioticus]|uniref:TerD family protein n=1 Tax=Streptomyces antibioticus TaxID=1890 RepID=UPI00369DAF50
MVKGANVGLASLSENVDAVIVSLGWASPTGEGDADVSVLLLDANGKVRDDADFYIEVVANPAKRLKETDLRNNVSLRKVVLGVTPGARTVKVPPFDLINAP